MGTYRADHGRAVSATARVGLLVTPTAAARLAQLAVLHCVTRAAFCRAAIEAFVHADDDGDRTPPPSTGPSPRAERADIALSVAVTPDTARALEGLAVRRGETKTAVVRRALEVAAVDSGAAPLFAPTAHQQRWPRADLERRPRGPAARVPGLASRCHVGLHADWRRTRHRADE